MPSVSMVCAPMPERAAVAASVKASVDMNTYMLAERARLMALTMRARAAQVKVETARGLTEASNQLQQTDFWRFHE